MRCSRNLDRSFLSMVAAQEHNGTGNIWEQPHPSSLPSLRSLCYYDVPPSAKLGFLKIQGLKSLGCLKYVEYFGRGTLKIGKQHPKFEMAITTHLW